MDSPFVTFSRTNAAVNRDGPFASTRLGGLGGEDVWKPLGGDGPDDEYLSRHCVLHALRNDSGLPETERQVVRGLPGVLASDAPVEDGVRLTGGK